MNQSKVRIACSHRGLLQTFRAMQAIGEAGFILLVPEAELARWAYASRWFNIPYALDPGSGQTVEIGIDHRRPRVTLGDFNRPLLLPHGVLDELRSLWGERRITASFMGNLTTPRRRALTAWTNKQAVWIGSESRYSPERVVVRQSTRGRSWPLKAWDTRYARLLGSSRFALCPNGDFVWTYRFFEAAAAGAIPIVEGHCEIYEGFFYYTMSDSIGSMEWSRDTAQANAERVRSMMAASPLEIRRAISNLH